MYRYRMPHRAKPANRRALLWIAPLVALVFGGLVWLLWPEEQPPISEGQRDSSSQVEEAEPLPPSVDLQPVVDAWVAGRPGDYGIVVYDPAHQQIIAGHQPDSTYFMASIYKLYIAYLALMDIDAGAADPDELYRGDWTRMRCIDEMIRTSDSPCPEQMMGEMGHAQLNERLSALGVTGDPFGSFETSAADVARLLTRLQTRQDLSEHATDVLLTAMREQIYRDDGMPAQVPEDAMAVKTGFYETGWHDAGIITMPDGREFIVAYFSDGAGSTQVADFGRTIYDVLRAE